MKVKEIAELVGETEGTVQEWIKIITRQAGFDRSQLVECIVKKHEESLHGVSVDYNEDETIAIIRQGMGNFLADVYKQNKENIKWEPKEVIDEVQLHELRMIYGPKEAAKRVDMIMGFDEYL